MQEHVYVFGAGGHGKVVGSILEDLGIPIAGYLDENPKKHGMSVITHPVVGGLDVLKGDPAATVALGIGDNSQRERIFNEIIRMHRTVCSVIHPTAYVSQHALVGYGVIIMPHATVNAGVTLGNGSVINTNASVDHDCALKQFCHIWPGAHLAGGITVGEGSYIGTGASVIQNIPIGKNVIIGAGAAVITPIPDNTIAVGVPAKIIKSR
jgi:sugar O-acyltransferase (sialic acid O-acetyltransferase NeuD family)